MRVILLILVFRAIVPDIATAQRQVRVVSASENGAAQVEFSDGTKIVIRKESGQVGIAEAQVAADGTVGWLVEYSVDGVSYPITQELILWREGRIVRRFPDDQVSYSWTFYAQGKQVAFHTGPLHGETKSHCEVHDIATGRRIAQWDGDLDSQSTRPAWTQGLKH